MLAAITVRRGAVTAAEPESQFPRRSVRRPCRLLLLLRVALARRRRSPSCSAGELFARTSALALRRSAPLHSPAADVSTATRAGAQSPHCAAQLPPYDIRPARRSRKGGNKVAAYLSGDFIRGKAQTTGAIRTVTSVKGNPKPSYL
ncbi:uncharacterized protein LOC126095545 [Schistocerca cancellata]|uniref:uncharacterized protein LOC126095545 n=1 Tax=Schistocerca cancellata TaxID=274614 RepID=UPI002118C20B|nr:uncharacterized protein LOC126095545 [Schistocerca cancellata]